MSTTSEERTSDPGAPPPGSSLRLLVALCAALARGDHGSARAQLAPGRVDWPALQTIADQHRLTGYLSVQLQGHGLTNLVPREFLFHARQVYMQQWVRNGQLFREIGRIAAALSAAQLLCLFFKGPLLANTLYEHLGSRAIWDIDLLLPGSEEIARYEAVFAGLGYRRRSRLLLPLALSRRWLYQLEYVSDAFKLEPHWSLQQHPSLALDFDRIWRERVTRVTPDGTALRALSDEYTLLANLLSIPADLQNASLKLRTYFELFLLWRRFPPTYDWPAFWERRRAERTQRLTRVALALLQDLFGPGGLEPPAALPLPETGRKLADELRAQMFASETGEWQRKRLAFRLFEAPLPVSLAWWACTLPVRALAHPTVTGKRLRWW